eukprot:Platyproteum_vivax@DN22_c0_g1_i1.p1
MSVFGDEPGSVDLHEDEVQKNLKLKTHETPVVKPFIFEDANWEEIFKDMPFDCIVSLLATLFIRRCSTSSGELVAFLAPACYKDHHQSVICAVFAEFLASDPRVLDKEMLVKIINILLMVCSADAPPPLAHKHALRGLTNLQKHWKKGELLSLVTSSSEDASLATRTLAIMLGGLGRSVSEESKCEALLGLQEVARCHWICNKDIQHTRDKREKKGSAAKFKNRETGDALRGDREEGHVFLGDAQIREKVSEDSDSASDLDAFSSASASPQMSPVSGVSLAPELSRVSDLCLKGQPGGVLISTFCRYRVGITILCHADERVRQCGWGLLNEIVGMGLRYNSLMEMKKKQRSGD